MTPTRRTRKTAKQNAVESQSSEEDSSDSGSVTRCVCGESHNVGLMVQCDKCEVWQHCECVGLEEEQIPDHYYCDYCQPDHHVVNASPTRPKRLYNITTDEIEEEEGSDNLKYTNPGSNSDAERQTKRRKKSPSTVTSSESSSLTDFSSNTTVSTASSSNEKVVAERRSRRTKLPADNNVEEIEEAPVTTTKKKNCVSCKRTNCSCHSENNKKATKSHHQSNHHSHSHHSNSTTTTTSTITTTTTATAAAAIISKTKMTDDNNNYWDEQGRPTRESSPPAKVRYPHSKMSFSDMNKRCKQIMELLNKMQTDLLKQPETPPLQVTLDDVLTDRRRYDSSSSSCSLSSASTVPIMDECSLLKRNFDLIEPPFLHEETSLEILDRVNRDLIKFQRKFGAIQQVTTKRLATKR